MLITSLAAPLFALQASAAGCTIPDPQFSMSTEADENIAAEVYLPCEGQAAEDLVAALVARDGRPVEIENTFEEREVSVRLTGLSEPDGDAKTGFLRRDVKADDVKPYVCRIHRPEAGVSAARRAMKWCMTFVVGPTATVVFKPPPAVQD